VSGLPAGLALHEPVIDYAGTFSFPIPPAELWRVISRFDAFQSWWPWLHELEVEGAGLVEGTQLRGTVMPPLPYHLHMVVTFEHCEESRLVEATVSGDLRGQARLDVEAVGEGSDVRLSWSLEMVREPLRTASRVAHPVVRWGHDRVVEWAVEGFSRTPTTQLAGHLERHV